MIAFHTGRKQTPEQIAKRLSKITGVKRKNPPSQKLLDHMAKIRAMRKYILAKNNG